MANASASLKVTIDAVDRTAGAFSAVSANLEKMKGQLRTAGLALTGFAAASGFLGMKLVQAASDADQLAGRFNVVFGAGATQAEAWARRTAAATGFSRQAIMRHAITLKSTAEGLGLASQEATVLSETMAQLGLDLADFANIPVEEALSAIQQAVRGNERALAQYGVIVTDAAVQQEVLRQGWAKSRDTMTDAMLAAARANLIIDATRAAHGAAAASAGTYEHQVRALKARMEELSISIGQKLLPFAERALAVVDKLAGAFAGLPPEVQNAAIMAALAATAFAAVVGPMFLVLTVLPKLATGFELAAAAIKVVPLLLGALGSPLGLIALAIGVLALAWATNWRNIRGVTQQAVDSVVQKLNLMIEGVNWVIRGLNKLPGVARLAILGTAEKLAEIPKIALDLEKTTKQAGEAIQEMWHDFSGMVSQGLGQIIPTIDEAIAKFNDMAGLSLPSLSEILKGIRDLFRDTGDRATDMAKQTEDAVKRMKFAFGATETTPPTPPFGPALPPIGATGGVFAAAKAFGMSIEEFALRFGSQLGLGTPAPTTPFTGQAGAGAPVMNFNVAVSTNDLRDPDAQAEGAERMADMLGQLLARETGRNP